MLYPTVGSSYQDAALPSRQCWCDDLNLFRGSSCGGCEGRSGDDPFTSASPPFGELMRSVQISHHTDPDSWRSQSDQRSLLLDDHQHNDTHSSFGTCRGFATHSVTGPSPAAVCLLDLTPSVFQHTGIVTLCSLSILMSPVRDSSSSVCIYIRTMLKTDFSTVLTNFIFSSWRIGFIGDDDEMLEGMSSGILERFRNGRVNDYGGIGERISDPNV